MDPVKTVFAGAGESQTEVSPSMTLPKFLIGMAAVCAVVAVWSALGDASLGTIFLRVIICAAVIQLGYFLAILFLVGREPRTEIEKSKAARGENEAAEAPRIEPNRPIR
ncbi:MAG: exopolysaccharide production repressor exox [Methylobacterium mesophilicum]|nr:exopolysaccharide production repressor exox [Methylobacterium mesophilicum]